MKKKSDPRINTKLILSLFDYTGNWARPWIDAGYPVMLWDKKVEGDILDLKEFGRWISGYEEFVWGFLMAPPCTEFAVSGARWWPEKDQLYPERLETARELVEMGMGLAVDLKFMFPNLQWWALENPVGRIETAKPGKKYDTVIIS